VLPERRCPLSSDAWYVALDGQQTGPLSRAEVEALKEEGRLAPDTLVWAEGMTEWAPAATTDLFPATPPPADAAPPAGGSVPRVAAPAQDETAGSAPPVSGAPAANGSGPVPAMRGVSFGQAIGLYFSRYVTFRGRAGRAEYWWAMLFIALANIALSLVDYGALGASPEEPGVLATLFAFGTILPTLAISVRRLHDIGRSGWWLLIVLIPLVGVIVILVFHLMRGSDGPNRFGGVVER